MIYDKNLRENILISIINVKQNLRDINNIRFLFLILKDFVFNNHICKMYTYSGRYLKKLQKIKIYIETKTTFDLKKKEYPLIK